LCVIKTRDATMIINGISTKARKISTVISRYRPKQRDIDGYFKISTKTEGYRRLFQDIDQNRGISTVIPFYRRKRS
ncbi:hypothetical protein, partial [Sutcliffiella rhizosphaerae]|uniref:hypothetical protein n=1 Tax=Sutcliffiella rhizosphaerae TaxID=2880967 RepID=UPI001E4AA8C8